MYNNLTQDDFTWKDYDNELYFNEHQKWELKFNISDAELVGSSDSVDKIPLVISKYQLIFDYLKLYADAFQQCKLNNVCGDVVNESDSVIVNYLYTKAYAAITSTSMTNTEWEAAHTAAEMIQETAQNKSSVEWFKLVDNYYINELIILIEDGDKILDHNIGTLIMMVKENKMAGA